MNNQLGLAIQYAVEVHKDQFDKGGNPYILHPLHLMNQFLWENELAIIAVLHDVVEDGGDMEYIRANFSDRVCRAIMLLTHNKKDPYDVYIEKMCRFLDPILIKMKDLEHNSDITRLKGIKPIDFLRLEKYYKAFIRLGEAKRSFDSH